MKGKGYISKFILWGLPNIFWIFFGVYLITNLIKNRVFSPLIDFIIEQSPVVSAFWSELCSYVGTAGAIALLVLFVLIVLISFVGAGLMLVILYAFGFLALFWLCIGFVGIPLFLITGALGTYEIINVCPNYQEIFLLALLVYIFTLILSIKSPLGYYQESFSKTGESIYVTTHYKYHSTTEKVENVSFAGLTYNLDTHARSVLLISFLGVAIFVRYAIRSSIKKKV